MHSTTQAATPIREPFDQDKGEQDRIYAKVTLRLISFLFIGYVFAFIDRTNVGFAKLGMQAELGFSEAVFGLGAGIFFVSYFLLEVPSNIMLGRFGARRWIARILITWGLLSAATLLVKTPTQFYAVRFLLGGAEAGFFPGVMLYLTQWYPAERRSRVITLFMAAIPVGSLLGGVVSGWILQHFASSSLMAAWQWLFLLEGVPAALVGVIALWYLDDGIDQARWLSPAEKQMLKAHVASDGNQAMTHSVAQAMRSPLVWLLAFVNFAYLAGVTLMFWMPSMLRDAGVKSTVTIGWMVAAPFALAVVGMLALGRTSDRLRERRWHTAIPGLISVLGVALMPFAMGDANLLLMVSLLAVTGNVVANALYWNLPTALLSGPAALVGIAFINAFGQMAGFLGPTVFGKLFTVTGSATTGLYLLAAMLALGSLAVLVIPRRLVNR
ncbi:MFS transporter [Cupriavidus basilensis]|uniref:MFS transporter n=1 Tax=Cupriavidus basilensis TaxID=68895 RepID=A0ABT6AYB0_9BURK|nr:MFS transporter [Cupriavidus basilensis]MDF3837615.1 MFS transporter [Cupriavidus basilensis]